MNYCAVTEAFDNSLKKQMVEYERNNNKNNTSKSPTNIIPPNTFDNYTEIDVGRQAQTHQNNMMIYPAFFTAQGDYSSKGPYFGTSINELKETNNLDKDNDNYYDTGNRNHDILEEDMSLLDGYSDESLPSIKRKIKPSKLDHKYCIDKILKSLSDEPDTSSLMSSYDDMNIVYKHVKACKYCKNKINKYMRKQVNQTNIDMPVRKELMECYDSNKNLGYGLKELLIIILGGIILVFILDLLVKIGKKLNK